MKKHMFILPVFLVAVLALIMGATAPQVWADDPECWFNIEFNASDLDVGVRGFYDFEPWEYLKIEDPNGDTIAETETDNSMDDQGKAEYFFESGEPYLGDVSFATFLGRFPDTDDYLFDANLIDPGGPAPQCKAEFTHVIPCAPEISVSGNRGLGVTISWEEVTQVVDAAATDAAIAANGDDVEAVCEAPGDLVPPQVLEIVGYEVIVENEDEKIYKIDLPGDATSVSVPPEFIEEGEEYQYEVLAIEESGNQTITEEEFCVNELNGIVEECEDNGD